jgi:hypothetical protein
MPRFTVVVVYYQGVHPDEIFSRGVASVLGQTFGDFEMLVYHDGPLLREVPSVGGRVPEVRATAVRHNDWGHSLRDRGIREASGDYILLFNADNILYPQCLDVLDGVSREPPRLLLNGQPADTDNILIFPIVYHDLARFMQGWLRLPKGSGAKLIMTGNPPVYGQIDCMQLVMKRQIWLEVGGWADKREDSDGQMYPLLCQRYGYRGVGEVLGEHW